MAKRAIPMKDIFLGGMNPLIRFLIIADTVGYAAAGLLGPIFALFIVDFIDGGSVAVAGISAGIFLITKSLFQIPTAVLVDKICGEDDDFALLFYGMIIVSLTPLVFLFINTPLQLYIVQFFLGIVSAATFPSFLAIFARHTEPGKEGVTWGIYYTMVDLSSATAAAVGGFLAYSIGFEKVIFIVAVLGIISTALYLPGLEYIDSCKKKIS